MSESSGLSNKALASALREARKKGLPEGWTVKLDKRRRRQWISPDGKSCDSIPKAIAISVQMGLLPPDTPIPTTSSSTKKKRSASTSPGGSASKKVAAGEPARPSTPDAISLAFNSDEEDPGPESDPETSLDVPSRIKANSTRPTTVHWDPDSPDGRKVGWRVRLWDASGNEWKDGRIVRYDPYTNKHKILYEKKPRRGESVDSDNCVWVRLINEVYQCATRLVWAHVKGFAWWPAMTMECDPPTFGGRTYKKGWEFVAFLGADEVATLRDSPECLRPFDSGKVDSVISKNKKKRNANAIKLACEEQIKIRETRNEACRFYAEKAFGLVSKQGMNLLGKKVQVFRNDVNYPYGETVVGKVRKYSTQSKKWLLSYDLSERTSSKYEASWVNLQAKDCDYKVLDKKKAIVPSGEDLVPFMRGFEPEKGADIKDDDEDEERVMTRMLNERCHGCVDYILPNHSKLSCTKCGGCYHPGCSDPPIASKSLQRIAEADEDWVCAKCNTCKGCHRHDIGFGAHSYPLPSSLSLTDGQPLNLCSMCTMAYEKKRFCPNCAHTWDDIRYQNVQRQIRWQEKAQLSSKGNSRKRKADTASTYASVAADDDEEEADPGTSEVDPSWYHPDTPIWGYTEEAMLICDTCKLWVHAACGGLNEDEYEQTSDGDHPVYSSEFLCRVCCKRRCKELIDNLQNQDAMMLFAVPVTEQMAPTYHDVIKNPMDLQTMSEKAENNEYLNYAWVREDFELMVLNALTFNTFQSKYWREAKRYYYDCRKKVFSTLGKAAPPGAYAKAVKERLALGEKAKQLEDEREKEDETTEKKDLVAGAQVASITLPPLSDPPDQPSCIPFTEVKLKPTEAYYCSWMECCFTCGSSGAADTMLFCVDCGEGFHSFCANAPIHSMDPSSVSGWRCPNCKICEISGEVPKDELRMLFCEMCDRGFSLDLLDPPLESAPPGLWICGQCVDCKTCGNMSEKKAGSLRYWSRDPEKCYRCGGCKGLLEESPEATQCPVCSKVWRTDDNDLVHCSSCDSKVHVTCDAHEIDSSASDETRKYECPSCRQGYGSQDQSKMLRKYLHDQAWLAIIEGPMNPDDSCSLLEMHEKLNEEIDWRVRNMWRDDYRSVIKEGFRLLDLAKDRFGHTNVEIRSLFDEGFMDLPLWMAQRAARFVRFANESQWEVDGFPKKSIKSLALVAKLAASFLKVACRAMDMRTKKTVRCYNRMMSLLRPPDDCGQVEIPIDTVRVDGNRNIFQPDEWNSKLQPTIDEDSLGIKVDGTTRVDMQVESEQVVPHGRRDETMYKIASPVLGWNENIDSADEQNRWKDPRSCCLCHMCGDDDAGFPIPVTAPSNSAESVPDIARVGRLLPMSDGLWVHASCALWSSEVWEAPSGGTVNAMEKARSRGSQLKCFGCGRQGATVGCFKANCPCNYHFPCAKACGGVFTNKQQMFCAAHKSCASDLLPRESFEFMKTLMIEDENKITTDKDASDGSEGNLCSRVGAIVVHSTGKIDQERDGFHSEKYITPPGYVATRIFWSARTPRTRTVYVLKVDASGHSNPVFSIVPGDDPSAPFCGSSADEAYKALMLRVKSVNKDHFSDDIFSKLPVRRKIQKKAYGLNGAQFFGFGLSHIRRTLETSPGCEALAAPLSDSSVSYRFCYVQPNIESVMDLQRKRAAVAAERALENSSGCARTEGMKAVTRSGGSGRITRALVRSAEEEAPPDLKKVDPDKVRADRETIIKKYREMKSVPLEQRLAARRSHIHGWGLFTKVDLPKDSMIIEYMGETVRQCIADKREKEYETSGIGSCYMFRLDLQHIVDATMIGCMARFMNHCCRPNAYAKVINLDKDILSPENKIVVFANRDIAAGEEITYDYKFPVEDGEVLRCTCGAPNCIGRMN